jgi:hypothetical protein
VKFIFRIINFEMVDSVYITEVPIAGRDSNIVGKQQNPLNDSSDEDFIDSDEEVEDKT